MTKKPPYSPLALKYRPRLFSQVLGQDVAVSMLKTKLQEDELPPVILLAGPHSCGKTTLARIVAMRLNCSDSSTDEPCLKCDSCRTKRHPDVTEMNIASERGIDVFRDLQNLARLHPANRRKVFILDECHQATPAAWSASLKLFEEPPHSTTFILATTDPQKLPDAILSRCFRLTLRPLGAKLLAKHLQSVAQKEGKELSADHAQRISVASGGHPREALFLLEQVFSLPGAIDEAVSRVLRDEGDRDPYTLFLNALVEGDRVFAIRYSMAVEDPIQFLQYATTRCSDAIRFRTDPRLVPWHVGKKLEDLEVKNPDDLLKPLKILARYLQLAKSYTLPGYVCRDLAVLEACSASEKA